VLIESESTKNKSNSQQKTLIQTILPCVALYKTLLQEGFSKEKTTTYLQKYMFDGEKKILNAGAAFASFRKRVRFWIWCK